MSKKYLIEQHSLNCTLRSYQAIIDEVQKVHGPNAHIKHPAIVSTLLRFQEEMVRSTTDLITSGKLDIKNLGDSNK